VSIFVSQNLSVQYISRKKVTDSLCHRERRIVMSQEERQKLIDFCFRARAELEGIELVEEHRAEFENMSDEKLEKEADWLNDMLWK
jgi:hypothetical protein